MEFDNVIASRRSIRKFKSDPITKEQIMAILEAGNKAPSAKNGQQWRFHVYINEAKDRFVKFCLEEFNKIANDSDVHPYAKYSFQIMAESPVVILIYSAQIMPHPCRPDIQSVSAAIENMLLKASDLGLGSLWICDILYIDIAVKHYSKIELPLIAAVSFGYSNEIPRNIKKLSVEEVTTWFE